MRISAAAVALCLAVTLNGTAASYNSQSFARPLWGVVSYGGDASPSTPDENADEKNSSSSSSTTVIKSTSSQILDSVSAGGGSLTDPAFVGSANSPVQATTATLKSPSSGTAGTPMEGSPSFLSVATNQQNNAEAVGTATTGSKEGEETGDQIPAERKQRPLKVLFLSSDTGGGHRASAEALANQFQRLFPGATYDLMDIWTDIDSSWPYCTIKDTYKSFSATPWKWRTLYYVSNIAMYSKIADIHSYYMNEELIREKMETYDPDVIVSVHPTMNYVPLFSIRKISEKTGRDIPFFTVVTDFGSGHCTWFNKDVDKMYLASEPIKKIAKDRGNVPDEKIVMSGLPIRYDFAAQADAMGDRTTEEGKVHQAKIREQLNIDTNKRMILVMGGGEGVGSLSDIVNELYAKLRTQGVDATICVICGRNEELKADLDTRCWDTVVSQSLQSYESLKSKFFTKILTPHAHRSRRIQQALDRAAANAAKGNDVADVPGNVDVIPLGFVTNIAEYMVAADVLVSKAGPGTIAEAAAVSLPIMLTSHLPGQEAGNVDIVLNGGFGDFCEDPETIGLEVACWLQDSQLLDDMSRKAMKVGHPHAAEQIAMDIGKTTHEWMERNELK
mmetsp:Transcript_11615/g.25458  ORF Transcript_11615/g.25458 Transcript_11615/m.25458 type:complete len:616 (-) Transcript_11615:420-2267(-)|eukprot:CAMPEP_0172327564 /NCGR_PEP_ID=MMETSP1058-20130122/59896_1 /TAXON_ID=83371 /ORGANISM="Detonula confervacea, Strain CCMP 353" /LENGTH=615 /DNA_ID=CAMNT_0013044645 /DNA_START=137 /DNA_END=1984 /DNA_ORIENTATION=+